MTDTTTRTPSQQARIDAKRAARFFTAEDAPPDLLAAEAQQQWWPSRAAHQQWWKYIMPDMGVTPDGYWYGHCPFHDWPASGEEVTALINFFKNSMKCLQNKETHCHERSAISLTNAYNDLQQQAD